MEPVLVAASMELRFDPHAEPLLPRIATGDASAVELFVDRYGGLIWSIAKRLTSNSQDSEDLVQEIFIDLWKSAADFQSDRGSEVTFIAVVARRRWIDRVRKNATRVRFAGWNERTVMDVVARRTDPLVEVADEATKAQRCLEQLTLNAQKVLQMVLQEGLSHQETANALDMPLGSVKSYARRGLLLLRECMHRPFFAPSQEATS